MTQDSKATQKRKKVNRLTALELSFLNKHARKYDTIEERAADIGIAANTYSRMMKYKYCGYETLEKLHEKISGQNQAA